MSGLGDAYAAMQPPPRCMCGECPQGHPSGLCDACVAKRFAPDKRRPCAGWGAPDAFGDRMLRTGDRPRWILGASERGGWAVSSLALDRYGDPHWTIVAQGECPTIEAAQLAAEDALRAIAAEILRAVGS